MRRNSLASTPKPFEFIFFCGLDAPTEHEILTSSWVDLHRGVLETAQRLGLACRILGGDKGRRWLSELSEKENPGRETGGVLALLLRGRDEGWQPWKILQTKLPCVNLKTSTDSPRDNLVRTDHGGGARRLVSLLVKEGFRRFSWVGLGKADYSHERFESFVDTLRELGLKMDDEWILTPGYRLKRNSGFTADLTDAQIQKIVDEELAPFLRKRPLPDVICAENDRLAWHLHRFFLSEGIRIPQDLALTGFDNRDFQFEPWGTNILTSVRQDNVGLASAGVQLLSEIASGQRPRTGQKILLPGEVILRHSTGRSRSPADSFRRDVEHWLLSHAREPGDPARFLASALGLDHRYLLEKYRKIFGEPLSKSVSRLRIQHAESLLRTTTLQVTEIWREVGYENQQSFNRHFRAITGRKPLDRRKG